MMKHTLFSFYLKLCTRRGASFIARVSWDVSGPVIETIPVSETHVRRGAERALWAAPRWAPVRCLHLWVRGHCWLWGNLTLPRWAKFVCITLVFSFLKPEFTCQHLAGRAVGKADQMCLKTVKNIEGHRLISPSWAHTESLSHIHTQLTDMDTHMYRESSVSINIFPLKILLGALKGYIQHDISLWFHFGESRGLLNQLVGTKIIKGATREWTGQQFDHRSTLGSYTLVLVLALSWTLRPRTSSFS